VLVVYQLIYKKTKGKIFKSQNFVDFLLRLGSTTTTIKVVRMS